MKEVLFPTGTYYAKWIELKHEGITLEYGSTSSRFPHHRGRGSDGLDFC